VTQICQPPEEAVYSADRTGQDGAVATGNLNNLIQVLDQHELFNSLLSSAESFLSTDANVDQNALDDFSEKLAYMVTMPTSTRFYETAEQRGTLTQPTGQLHKIQAIRNENMDQYRAKCTERLQRDHLVEQASQCPSKSTVFENPTQWHDEVTAANLTLSAEKGNNYCFVLQNFPASFFDAAVAGNPLTDGRYSGFDDPCARAMALIQDYGQFNSAVKTLSEGLR